MTEKLLLWLSLDRPSRFKITNLLPENGNCFSIDQGAERAPNGAVLY
jgi:hypothetical protein